jgi:DNA replication protein DnaC
LTPTHPIDWLGFQVTHPALELARERVAEFIAGKRLGLILAGKPGCGKTHLARVISSYNPPHNLLFSEPDVLARLQAAYGGEGSEAAVMGQLRFCEVLLMDDVGAGHVRPESHTWLEGIYWRILERRFERKHPVLLTTNFDFRQLGFWIGERAMSRLIRLCGSREGYVDMFEVPDYRRSRW